MHLGFAPNDTFLRAAEDGATDGGRAADVDIGVSAVALFKTCHAVTGTQDFHFTLTATKDVTRAGVGQHPQIGSVVCCFSILHETDGIIIRLIAWIMRIRSYAVHIFELKRGSNLRAARDGHACAGRVGRIPTGVVQPITGICHLAAAEDGAIDFRTAADFDSGIGQTGNVILVVLVELATARAIDVAGSIVVLQQVTAVVEIIAHVASADFHLGLAVMFGSICCARRIGVKLAFQAHASESYHAAAIEIAQNLAARHHDVSIAAHTTCVRVQGIAEITRIEVGSALAAAKHAAIITRKARGADDTALDQDPGAVQDVSVLAAAEYVAIDKGIAADGDAGAVHIVQGFMFIAEVALATTVNATHKGESLDGTNRFRHTHRTAAHRDDGLGGYSNVRMVIKLAYRHFGMSSMVSSISNEIIAHVGGLVAAIHVAEDVPAGNLHFGMAEDLACVGVPNRSVACR